MATYSFTIRATDSAGVYSDRSFSIAVQNTSIDRFIAVSTQGIVRSPDGFTWTYDSLPRGNGIQYGGGKWLIWGTQTGQSTAPNGSQYPANWFYSSVDGVTWNLYQGIGIPTNQVGWSSIKYRNGKWMAFSRWNTGFGLEYWESTDAVTWTKIANVFNALATSNNSEGMCDFEYYNGTWVGLYQQYQAANAGFKGIVRSTNGTTWTVVPGSVNNSVTSSAAETSRTGGVTNVNGLWMVCYGYASNTTAADAWKQWGLWISYDTLTWEVKSLVTGVPVR